jgi:hypothetical protein
MSYNSTSRLYYAMILGQSEGTFVKYKVIAYDNAGNMAVEDNAGQYFTYTVIPEFSSATILALFMILTMLVAVFARKKLSKKLET